MCMCVCVTIIIKEKEAINLRWNRRGKWERLEEGKGRENDVYFKLEFKKIWSRKKAHGLRVLALSSPQRIMVRFLALTW